MRQVRMYHVATPPEPGETEYFEMASEGDGDWVSKRDRTFLDR